VAAKIAVTTTVTYRVFLVSIIYSALMIHMVCEALKQFGGWQGGSGGLPLVVPYFTWKGGTKRTAWSRSTMSNVGLRSMNHFRISSHILRAK